MRVRVPPRPDCRGSSVVERFSEKEEVVGSIPTRGTCPPNFLNMWYVYILKSKRHQWFYVGLTNDLRKRFTLHNNGKVESTKKFKPFIVVYYEAHNNKHDAVQREKFLKTGWGKNWIKRTLKSYLKELKS